MDSKVNYAVVGLFVVVLSAALFIFAFWLSSGFNEKKYNTYEVYVSESVAGLNVNASVKYNGVDVGYVSKISLRPGYPKEVIVTLKIEQGAPITTSTRAMLQVRGLTGLAYIGLLGGAPDAKPLEPTSEPPYPIIKTVPSLLYRLDTAVTKITDNITSISKGVQALVDVENRLAVRDTLQNFKQMSTQLLDSSKKVDSITKNLDITLQRTAVASEQLPAVMNQVNLAATHVATASQSANTLMVNGGQAIDAFSDQALPELIITLRQLQELTDNLQVLSQELTDNPSVIIRGREPLPPGPGE